MKVHILYDFESNRGGGNQFLKTIKEYFLQNDVYARYAQDADVILFNSHHCIRQLTYLKYRFPQKICIHRVDGPMRLYNHGRDRRDDVVGLASAVLADGTIFQSQWSKEENLKSARFKEDFYTVIMNAPDGKLFNRNGKVLFLRNKKIRLVAVSWSDNWKKGFEIYKWLDANLNFNKYEMFFIGRSPVPFQNIIHIPHADSEQVAMELKRSDIYITASQKDPCSNALLEAMHCGLPAVAYADGGHPEIVGGGGELFRQPTEIHALLEKIVNNYDAYQSKIAVPPLQEVGTQYYRFCQKIFGQIRQGNLPAKSVSVAAYLKILLSLSWWKLEEMAQSAVKSRKGVGDAQKEITAQAHSRV